MEKLKNSKGFTKDIEKIGSGRPKIALQGGMLGVTLLAPYWVRASLSPLGRLPKSTGAPP